MDEWLTVAVDGVRDEVVDTRRQVHTQPELSMVEHHTTELIVDRLRSFGLTPEPCPTETGAVATIEGGGDGPTVLLRADIDALPLDEPSDRTVVSRHDGVMHACGHDGHVAILLGVASALAARAEDLAGRVMLVFQPGEEVGAGSQAMLDGGLLHGRSIDAVLGLHLTSLAPTGLVGMKAGTAWAGADRFSVTVRGEGGHGALTGPSGNPLMAAATIAQRLGDLTEGLSFENVAPACSAGTLQAGRAANVVPNEATVVGTVRTFTEDQREECLRRLAALLAEVDDELATASELDLSLPVPPVVNDPPTVDRLRRTLGAQLGADNVLDLPPVTTSDDVSRLLRAAPGAYLLVGAGIDDGVVRHHHTARFDLDERALSVGVASLLAGTYELLAG